MDALKAAIQTKRKALDEMPSKPSKYMRRGDIERLKEEEERKAREAERLAKEEAERNTPKAKVRLSFSMLATHSNNT